MNDKHDFKSLIQKYRKGQCTPQEKAALETWLISEMGKPSDAPSHEEIQNVNSRMLSVIDAHIGTEKKSHKLWTRIAAAAVLLLVAGLAAFWFTGTNNNTQKQQELASTVVPGGNKAVLTLSSGKTISLTDANNGLLASEASTRIRKSADGQLVYESGKTQNPALTYNTMSTPRGGQYSLTLSDGTLVVLNAASKLKYPATFSGNERAVELSGEAYFQVAKDRTKPFLVKTKGQQIQVLGTHFNVNAYDDEPAVKSALLEGSIKVTAAGQSQTIRPGEQSVLYNNALKVEPADLSEAVAWKNGEFIFNAEPLESIMRKISRWYDVEVVFRDDSKRKALFGGSISRFSEVTKLLGFLQRTKLATFKLENHTIIIN